ncbi:hypothetical protein K431DRAFT_286561 [Polychaeton citri CBS 116435]|uniref:Uncharacterized protein n=1 Tax=Polychaeton citri CBS 116435 TaxID=1314669 RepID=A0A9P4Q704_9PEZI|nr:hypothetical protein K431DRAFT_286561 [Polychaeton citri CBS 116435]
MGIIISSPVKTAPFTVVSTVIGFVSFAFTIGTFLKVVWVNLETVSEAPHEVHEYLNNLRQELIEEKASLRLLRRQCRRRHKWRDHHPSSADRGLGSFRGMELDDASLKTMNDMIKSLMRQFRDIEKPFLKEGEEGIAGEKRHHKRRNSSNGSPYYEHSAYAFPEKTSRRPSRARGRSADRQAADRQAERLGRQEDDEETFWAQRVQYAKLTFLRRLKWIGAKPKAQGLFTTLSKVQTRRIAQQVGGIALLMHEHGNVTLDMEDRIRRIDDRVSRVVGIRRVD